MLYGILGLSIWGYIIATLLLTHITIISVTIYLHRHQAHRALNLHPIASHFFRFWLWLTTGTITKEWAAIHRKHHARCETPDDPHSPVIAGIRKVLWQGYELYREEAKNPETLTRYGHGTPDDWLERHLYSRHSSLGIILMFILDLVLFGIPGITVWAVQMIWIPFFAAGVVNGIGHYWGYRNFECPDAARNIFPWGILIGGEELHNNHHTYGSSAKFSVKWWEFDLAWGYIRLLQALRLAKVNKVPPKLAMTPGKTQVDPETLRAVLLSRFQIMAHYTKQVVLPVLNEEKQKASDTGRALLQKAKSLLISADHLIDDKGKQYLVSVLADSQALQTVYQYRAKLQEIWNRTTASQKELIEALQEWCKQAEATGIEGLRHFADTLRSYTLCSKALSS